MILVRPKGDPVTVERKPDGAPGADGKPPDRSLNPGAGDAGEWSIEPLAPYSLGHSFDSTYFLKLLMRGKNLYLMSPPGPKSQAPAPGHELSENAFDILNWLVKTLQPLHADDGGPDDEFRRKREIFR